MTNELFITNFKPTYLYIKQHTITGKLYFGKTTEDDPVKYPGSGTHWKLHVKKHGIEHVVTLWYCLFTDKEELTKFALSCSEQWNIVESKTWLNKIPENGLDGGSVGKMSNERKLKISLGKKGKPLSKEHSKALSDALRDKPKPWQKGRPRTEETKLKISLAKKGQPYLVVKCPHCGKTGRINNMKRWHFDKCKVAD